MFFVRLIFLHERFLNNINYYYSVEFNHESIEWYNRLMVIGLKELTIINGLLSSKRLDKIPQIIYQLDH